MLALQIFETRLIESKLAPLPRLAPQIEFNRLSHGAAAVRLDGAAPAAAHVLPHERKQGIDANQAVSKEEQQRMNIAQAADDTETADSDI